MSVYTVGVIAFRAPTARNGDESNIFLESVFLLHSNNIMGSSVSFSIWKFIELKVPIFFRELKVFCQEEFKVFILPRTLFQVE